MNKIRLKKSISIFIIALFAIALMTVTVSQAADSVVKGTIVSIDPVSGMVEIQSEDGKTVMLNADPQTVDLKSVQKGDKVMIQYDKDKAVQSLEKEG